MSDNCFSLSGQWVQGGSGSVSYTHLNLTEQDLRVLGEVLEFMKSNDLLSNPDITMDDILELKYLEMAGYR